MWANMKRFHLADTGIFIDKLARMPPGTKYSITAVAQTLNQTDLTTRPRASKDSACIIPLGSYARAWLQFQLKLLANGDLEHQLSARESISPPVHMRTNSPTNVVRKTSLSSYQ